MLDVPVGYDGDITRFLRAKCVLSAAKPTNEINAEDKDCTASKQQYGPTQSILTREKPVLSARIALKHRAHSYRKKERKELNPTQVSLAVIK